MSENNKRKIDFPDSVKHDWHRGRINITQHILNAHYNSWLKPSDLAAFIIIHRHYGGLLGVPEVEIEIPPYVENHADARLNYLKNLARSIEEKMYD